VCVVAVCCCMLQCVDAGKQRLETHRCVAVYYSSVLLQCVAVSCCSVL